MTINHRFIVVSLLGLSGVLLSSLVPGGPIENRDFSHIDPSVLLIFNIFLTILGIGSFVLIRYVIKARKLGWRLSIYAGISYLLVYTIDLIEIFPKTPTTMSPALFWVEIIGIILAIPLIYFSYKGYQTNSDESTQLNNTQATSWRYALLGIAGAGVVVYATWSAMGPAV